MKYVLFDLDGTLTNPKLGITKSVQYALRAFDIDEPDLDSLCRYIGPPLRTSFMEYHGMNEEQAEIAITKYRERFSKTGLYENEVYAGITNMLKRLKEAGKLLFVATSKPEEYSKIILEHFHMDQYFTDICGATMDNSRCTKEEIIRYALEKNHIMVRNDVVMIGDRLHDIEGAKKNGIASIGVLYGFGSREELEQYGADQIAESVEALYRIIMDWD